MKWLIPLADLDYGEEEVAAVGAVLRSRWLSMGSVTQQFETDFAKFVGANHALAVANGTAALHLACLAVGLEPGDEAIVPSMTFVATANCVRYTGAEVVFADITSEDDLNISPEAIARAITPRTKAVVVMHYGGYACQMPEIVAMAAENNLAIIEDAAHAVGSKLDDRYLGTWGDIGCYSFFANKNLATGEGGMLVTNDDELADKLRLLRSHGMTSLTWDRHHGHASSYDVVALGYNYRIDEIRAALGLVQLQKLERNNSRRRELTVHYHRLLSSAIPEMTLPFAEHRGISAAHLMPIVLPSYVDRLEFMSRMRELGIQTSIHYPAIHRFTVYSAHTSASACMLKVTDKVAEQEVTLPLYPTLTRSAVSTIVELVVESVRHSESAVML